MAQSGLASIANLLSSLMASALRRSSTSHYAHIALAFFSKGKTAIIVPSKEQLVATIDTLIDGVKAGELDEHLTQQAKARGMPKSKRAA
jgi:hypothetical protein